MAGPLDFGLHHGLGPYNVHWAREEKTTHSRSLLCLGPVRLSYAVGNAR